MLIKTILAKPIHFQLKPSVETCEVIASSQVQFGQDYVLIVARIYQQI